MCGYRLLRELGSRARPRYVANRTKGIRPTQRVVVELFDESEAIVRNAKGLVPLRHSKLVSVREVVVEGGVVAVESDYVEGEWLSDLLEDAWRAKPPPLRALFRVLLDVLEGVTALHRARGPFHAPLKLVHGELAPANILVGMDGVARLANLLRGEASDPSPEVIGYVAPEVLLHDQSADERADVFSAGVVLWEALSGRRLHSATRAGEIVVRLLGGKVQKAEVPPALSWAEPLAEVARRALLPEISARYPTAADMANAVKSAVALNLGAKGDVGALVQALAGPRIRARTQPEWLEKAAAPEFAVPRSSAPPPSSPPSGPLSARVHGEIPTLRPPGSLPPNALERVPPSAPLSVDAVEEIEVVPATPDEHARVTAVPRISAPPVPSKAPAAPVPSRAPPSRAPAAAVPSTAPSAPFASKAPAPPVPSAPFPSGPPPSASRLSVPTPIIPISEVSALTKSLLARAPQQVEAEEEVEPDEEVLPPVLRSEPVPPPAALVTTPPAMVLAPVVAPVVEEAPIPEGTEVSVPPLTAPETLTLQPRRRRRGAILLAFAVALPIAMIGWFALGSSHPSGAEHAVSSEPPKREVGLAAHSPEERTVRPPPADIPPPPPVESAAGEAPSAAATSAETNETPSTDAGTRTASPPAAAGSPAASSSGNEVASPPPLRKKSKASYYPLGI